METQYQKDKIMVNLEDLLREFSKQTWCSEMIKEAFENFLSAELTKARNFGKFA